MADPHGPAYGRSPRRGKRSGLLGDLGRLARASGALARDHLLLAKAEVKQEGKRTAIHLGVGAVALPFALTSLIMLSTALALGLSRWVGAGWAFLIVGGFDLFLAGVAASYAALKLKEEKGRTLRHTKAELLADRRAATETIRRARVRTGESVPVRAPYERPFMERPTEYREPPHV